MTRERSAKRPTDKADLATGFGMDLLKPRNQMFAIMSDGLGAKIAAKLPMESVVAQFVEIGLQRLHRKFGGHETGEQEHRMAIAFGRLHQKRAGPGHRTELGHGTGKLGQSEKQRGTRHVFNSGSCQKHSPANFMPVLRRIYRRRLT